MQSNRYIYYIRSKIIVLRGNYLMEKNLSFKLLKRRIKRVYISWN